MFMYMYACLPCWLPATDPCPLSSCPFDFAECSVVGPQECKEERYSSLEAPMTSLGRTAPLSFRPGGGSAGGGAGGGAPGGGAILRPGGGLGMGSNPFASFGKGAGMGKRDKVRGVAVAVSVWTWRFAYCVVRANACNPT